MYNIKEIVPKKKTYNIIHVNAHTKLTSNKHACSVCTVPYFILSNTNGYLFE